MTGIHQDRRREPRYSYPTTAILKTVKGDPETSSVQVLGIGVKGCRIAVERHLEVDQEFVLIFKPNGEEIVANVIVRYWHRPGFAGLHFTSMSEKAKKRLDLLVEKISRTMFQIEPGSSR